MAQYFTDEDFKVEVLESNLPVLVDFYADWCGPCKMMAPVIDELATEYNGKVKVGKINVDENQDIAGQYNIMSIPTIILFKDGKVAETIVGAVPKSRLQELLV